MDTTEFNIGIYGLTNTERAAVSSVCNLTKHRKRRYHLVANGDQTDIHIALVDGDDPNARRSWTASSPFNAGRPALLVAGDPDSIDSEGYNYTMNRGYFAGRLIRTLDEVALQQFRSLPELKVDDDGQMPSMINQHHNTFGNANSPIALVVDDSEVVRMQMRALLEPTGMRVMAVESAEQALEVAAKHRFDIIFLDIELPEMDGYTACRKLKGRGKANDCPVVMLTGRDSAFDRIRGVMAGCSRYMIKPVAGDDLYSVLNQFVPQLQAKAS